MRDILMAMIDVSTGRMQAQLVFKNVNLVNVFTGEVYKTDVAVHDGYIAGIGEYSGATELDLTGKYICPGFIDSHVHIESSMVTPGEYARSVIPHGTTTVIADPHEIANVKGIAGIKYMLDGAENNPLDIHIMLPSCVPATPFENAGSVLKSEDLMELMHHPRVLGLGEVMDFPNVLGCEKSVMNKIVLARNAGKPIDGHAPGLTGKDLNGYVMPGIQTDHECTTMEAALERLRLGMAILFREGSAARNISALLPVVTPSTLDRCMFCTDDRNPDDILHSGHIDNNIKTAVALGMDAVTAIRMATLNAARQYHLDRIGAIAPGYKANVVVLDNLTSLNVLQVYKKGRLVAENGKPLFAVKPINDSKMRNSVNVKPLHIIDFQLTVPSVPMHVIGLKPHSLLTEHLLLDVTNVDGQYMTNGERLLKLAVLERHHATGNIGVALAKGLGLTSGAIASSIAHDSHNIVVIGTNDSDMLAAVQHLTTIGGGIAIADAGEIKCSLPLPIGGIMSDRPLEWVQKKLQQMHLEARKMGVLEVYDPFMTLAFLALPVIPSLKLTDLGLFDVDTYSFVDKV